MSLETEDLPALRTGECLVEVLACALCRSDLHTVSGNRTEPTPTILGHEICGRIAAFGPDAARFDADGAPLAVGSRVTWSVTVGCGMCGRCRAGYPQKCERLFKYGHRRVTAEEPLSGGLASHLVLRKNSTVFAVPDSLSDALASLANCSTATVAAVLKAAGSLEGRSVLIFGAGILGVTACAMARSRGAARVDVVEPNAGLHDRAVLFGADSVVAAAEVAGRYDVVLELSGSRVAAESAVDAAAVGGTVVLAGTVAPVGTIPLDPERVVRGLLTVRGVHNYHPMDLGEAVEFLAGAGQSFPFAELIGQRFPLSEVNSAFALAATCSGQRILIQP